ncbi:MAG: hypothetical protein OHK0019_08020 [Saprospiraceae bacterium]
MWGLETNNGFLLAGRGRPLAVPGVWNGLLIRTDKQGEIIWYKNYGSGNAIEYFHYVATTDDGGFVACGSAQGDAWLVRVDSTGEVLWQKTLGAPLFQESPDGPIVSVPNGFIVSGTKKSLLETLGSFVARIDNDGDVVWSRYYATDTPSIVRNLAVHHATDSALYAISLVGKKVGFIRLNPVNGDIIKAVEYEHPNYSLVSNGLQPTPDGNLALQGIAIPVNSTEPSLLWLIISNPDGQVIRAKAYPSNNTWGGLLSSFSTLSDGGFVLSPIELNQSGPDRRMLMKLDSNGEVLWKKSYGKVPPSNFLVRCFESSDGGLVAIGTHDSEGGDDDFFLMKTDANGEIASCCSQKRDIIPAIDFPIEIVPRYYQQENYLSTVPYNLTPPYTLSYFDTSICTVYPRPILYDTLQFCPSESVTIGDSTYSQPATVSIYLPSADDGCDTLAVYTLEHEPLNPNSTLQLTCPGNISVSAAGPVAVNYAEPVAASDCTCPDIALLRTGGGASGSLFPIGLSTVCYRADDACGQSKTCCFTVSVEAPTAAACDTKNIGCLRFELLQVNRDTAQNWVYHIRLTNTCADAVRYAYLQVPDGVQALAPIDNTVYTTPNGHTYTVRNPNFSPFYSVRFHFAGATLAGGQSEVFRYVLPPQADVDYIHVAARLASGAFIEAYLNTFYCPVGTESLPKPEVGERSASETTGVLKVYPNPMASEEALTIEGSDVEGSDFVLRDLTGRVVLEAQIAGGQIFLRNADLPNGIYFFSVQKNGDFIGSGKIVVAK